MKKGNSELPKSDMKIYDFCSHRSQLVASKIVENGDLVSSKIICFLTFCVFLHFCYMFSIFFNVSGVPADRGFLNLGGFVNLSKFKRGLLKKGGLLIGVVGMLEREL